MIAFSMALLTATANPHGCVTTVSFKTNLESNKENKNSLMFLGLVSTETF